jgi:cobalamin biosynthesis protein CbiD
METEVKNTEPKSKPTAASEVFEWLEVVVSALLAVVIIFTFAFRVATIVGGSMENTLIENEKVIITGGEGVGKITKPGLQVPVGDYAINPVPRRMIVKNLEGKIPEGKAAKVVISIPEGEKIAKKTMNPKLGIVGGISVLGTTGIARSMSSDAYKNSIVTQLDVALASNIEDLVFVPGNIGEKLALKKLNVSKEQIVQTGNYVGFMFEEAEKRGLECELLYCLTAIDSFYGLKNKVFGDFVTAYDSNDIYNVIAPTEKKLYRYKERDIVKRFFARDRINLLEEVIK